MLVHVLSLYVYTSRHNQTCWFLFEFLISDTLWIVSILILCFASDKIIQNEKDVVSINISELRTQHKVLFMELKDILKSLFLSGTFSISFVFSSNLLISSRATLISATGMRIRLQWTSFVAILVKSFHWNWGAINAKWHHQSRMKSYINLMLPTFLW